MGRYETILFISFIAAVLPAFGLYHLMIFKVNRSLPPGTRVPHTLAPGWSSRLSSEYKRLYPESRLYPLTMFLVIVVVVIALLLAAPRAFE